MAKRGRKKKVRVEPIGSDEWQDWHLTTEGWVEGEQKLDCMPRKWKVEMPHDRLLTCRMGDRLDTVFDAPEFYVEERWRTKRTPQLMKAVSAHGVWPPDFRTETLQDLRPNWLSDLSPG